MEVKKNMIGCDLRGRETERLTRGKGNRKHEELKTGKKLNKKEVIACD